MREKRKMSCGWKRRKRTRPDEILAAAVGIADERGTRAVRMRDVAERAGVSVGTIYLYFSGKENLFDCVTAWAASRKGEPAAW